MPEKTESDTAAAKWIELCRIPAMRSLLFFFHDVPTFSPILYTTRIYLFAARWGKWKDIAVRVKLEHFSLGWNEKQWFLETQEYFFSASLTEKEEEIKAEACIN